MKGWYVQRDGEQKGPISSSALKKLAKSGKLRQLDLVRKEDAMQWQSAGRIPELFPEGTAAETPPPLPQERQVAAPEFVSFIRRHWKQTKGSWFLPVLAGVCLVPMASLFKPVIGWSNLAVFTALLAILSLSLFVIYLIHRVVQHIQGKWEVTEKSQCRLARIAYQVGLLAFPILASLVAVEYFTPDRGLLVAAIPKLQVLQDQLIGDRKPLPALSDLFQDSGQSPEIPEDNTEPLIELPAASSPDESLANARKMAHDLLPTLTEYRAEELLVKEFLANKQSAERSIEQSNDILHRGGNKPHIREVVKNPNEALRDLEIPPDPTVAERLHKCREDINAVAAGLNGLRKRLEAQRAFLAKTEANLEVERKQLEESFRKFPAMKEQQKQQQRERQASRARNTIAPINNEIGSIQQDIAQLEDKYAELKRKELELVAAVADSIRENTKIYFREVNRVGPLLHAAGFPKVRGDHETKKRQLHSRLLHALRSAATQMKKMCKQNAPQEPNHEGLQYLAGITHIIEGNRYCMENKVVTIPDRYKSLYLGGRVGPNEVALRGLFRFVGNSTGKNGFGASINVELYECDQGYSEAIKRVREHERECRSFLKPLEPLDSDDGEDLIQVLENLVGEEKVDAALAEGKHEFQKVIASRKPFSPIVPPKTLNNQPVEPSRENDINTKLADLEDQPDVTQPNTTAEQKTEVTDVPPVKKEIGLPKDRQKPIDNLIHIPPEGPSPKMRWISVDVKEAETLTSRNYWKKQGVIGYGAVDRESGTVPLWRFLAAPDNRYHYFLNQPASGQKSQNLLAWVWTKKLPGTIEVFVLESGGSMQLVTETNRLDDGQRRRDWLIDQHGWRQQFKFYIYPATSE
jgi:hypothetical protein